MLTLFEKCHPCHDLLTLTMTVSGFTRHGKLQLCHSCQLSVKIKINSQGFFNSGHFQTHLLSSLQDGKDYLRSQSVGTLRQSWFLRMEGVAKNEMSVSCWSSAAMIPIYLKTSDGELIVSSHHDMSMD